MKIKNILFDFGGVVAELTTKRSIERFTNLGVKEAWNLMGLYGHKDIFLQVENGTLTDKEFLQRVRQIAGKEAITWEEVQYCWVGTLGEVNVDRLHYITQLRSEGYKTFLVSNTNPFIMEWAKTSLFSAERKPIGTYFDKLYCSYELKVCKPEKSFFLKIIEDGKLVPEESLFIDDSEKNLQTAQSLGFQTLLSPLDCRWDIPLKERLALQ